MSTHVEWFRDPQLTVAAPGDIEDGYGSTNDEAALVIANDDVAVIEVTEGNYAAFARRLREIADAFDPHGRQVDEDPDCGCDCHGGDTTVEQADAYLRSLGIDTDKAFGPLQ